MHLLASIPSPSNGAIELGPLTIHMYGLTLLAAIGFAIWITGTRWVNRGGDWDLIFRCAVWGVGAGIVGARLYHVATSWSEVPEQWWGPFAIWKGGLGVWGGIAAGVIVGAVIAKRSGADVRLLADCLAPGLLVAQAVGTDRQLVEPGALRQAHGPALGPRDRPCASAARDARPGHVPPGVPLRGDLESSRCRAARLPHRAAVPPPPAGPLRPLRRALLLRALLDRAHPHRPGERHSRPPRQHLGVRDRLHRRDRLVRALATTRTWRATPTPPKGPRMDVPKSRVRPGG